MPVQLGDKGQPGFDEPIALMMDCHRRIEGFLAILERVADRFAGSPLDAEATRAMRMALGYFKTAAPRHAADEEDSLFPALRALDRDDLADLLERAEALEAQHRRAETLHDHVHERAERWLKEGSLDAHSLESLRGDLASLRTLYREHIDFEDRVLFPAAARALDREDIQRIGTEMAARRGLANAAPIRRTNTQPDSSDPR